MLDKKQIRAIFFLIRVQNGFKAMEATLNINNAFGPETANEHTVWWWFKKFCKGDKKLKVEEHSDWPLKVHNDHLRASSKLILLQLQEKLLKNSTSTPLQLFGIGSKLERWKAQWVGVSWADWKSKIHHFQSVVFSYSI